jgi:hypothetical protein
MWDFYSVYEQRHVYRVAMKPQHVWAKTIGEEAMCHIETIEAGSI